MSEVPRQAPLGERYASTTRPVPPGVAETHPGDHNGGDGGPPAGDGPGSRPPERRGRSFLAELPVLVLVAFVLALLLKTFLVQAFYIPSESMLPTLAVGDRVLVNKIAHEFREPQRGEVVVFTQEDAVPGDAGPDGLAERAWEFVAGGFGLTEPGDKDFIKRIIGLPGETIEMREGVVYIDDDPVPEAAALDGGYLSEPDMTDFGPTEVPDDHYFMMGDNRPNSSDSRSMLDTIPEDQLVGRAFVVIWPMDRLSGLEIADYDPEAATTAR